MNPRDYLKKHGKDHVEALCARCGTTYSYYRVVAYGGGQFSGPLARRFAEETRDEMSVHDLRPDIFGSGATDPAADSPAAQTLPPITPEPARPSAPAAKIPLREDAVLRRDDVEDDARLGLTVRSAGPGSPAGRSAGSRGGK